MWHIVLLLGLAASPPPPSVEPALQADERVRIRFQRGRDPLGARGTPRRTGRFVEEGADGVRVRLDGAPAKVVLVPPAAIVSLERSLGKRPGGTRRGALAGLLIGAGVGAAVGAAAGACGPDEWCILTPGRVAAMGAVVFGATGVCIGAAVGSARGERWQPATAPFRRDRLSLRAMPLAGGAGGALALSF